MYIEHLTGVSNGYVQIDSSPKKSVNEGEQTDSQDRLGYYSGGTYGYGPLGLGGYSGYSRAPFGCMETYRWMDCNPTLTLGKGVTVTPCIGAPYSVEANQGVPDKWVTCVETAFLKNIMFLARDAFDCLSLQWQPFEVYWENEAGFIVPRFKSLLQEMTAALVEKETFRVLGLKNDQIELTGPNWYTFAEHPKGGKLWSKSRHESCREDAWWPWMEANKFGGRLDKKATGIVFMVKGPQGGSLLDQNNISVTGQAASLNLANILQQGISAYSPNALLSIRELKQHPELAKVSAFDVQYFDLGDTAGANKALNEKQRYYDSLMFRAWKRPERSATEGQRGTLAEAEVHGDIGTDDSDLLRSLFAKSLNDGPVNNCLEQNFGPQARGKVYLKPAPIVPARFQVLRMLMEKIASVPALLTKVIEETDMDAVHDVLGVPKRNDLAQYNNLPDLTPKAPEATGTPEKTNAQKNGNRLPA